MLRNSYGTCLCFFSILVEMEEINRGKIMAIHKACQLSLEKEWIKDYGLLLESD